MKKREIFLDFTSLLDVTLIVIFFFVIFSHLENVENTQRTDAKVEEMNEAILEAEASEENAEALAAQLQEEIALVQEFNERQASNVSEIIAYARSGNVKLVLVSEGDSWLLRVNCQDETIREIVQGDDIATALRGALEEVGYETEDTIFCDFVFDGTAPGTAAAYRKITGAIEEVQEEYSFLYFSETDLSVGGE